jgi:hypothetical protein
MGGLFRLVFAMQAGFCFARSVRARPCSAWQAWNVRAQIGWSELGTVRSVEAGWVERVGAGCGKYRQSKAG